MDYAVALPDVPIHFALRWAIYFLGRLDQVEGSKKFLLVRSEETVKSVMLCARGATKLLCPIQLWE
jgi:hypothetical protein